jgi:hypothetical protein
MKAYYLIGALAVATLSGCAYYSTPPVAYQPAVVTTPSVAVTPGYVAPSGTVIVR